MAVVDQQYFLVFLFFIVLLRLFIGLLVDVLLDEEYDSAI